MRHGKKQNNLSRKSAHRKAMLSNMACSLIQHKRIETTVAKAKALRVYVEPLMTKSKVDSTHSRRIVFKYLQSKDAVTELFREISPKIAERNGGYTRIIRLGNRLGDNAEMCMIELVDYNELMTKEPKEKKTRRSRRGGGAKSTTKDAAPKAEKTEDDSDKKAKAEKTEKSAAKKESTPKAKAEKKTETPKADAEAKSEKKEAKKADSKEDKAPAAKKDEKKEDSEEK
jgi:large subunit ribosomal protein L17